MFMKTKTYKEAFDVRPGEVISLVGGGGKTTLMFALAQELTSTGELVITTTTTKILEPSSSQTRLLLVETDEDKIVGLLLENVDKYRHITLVSERLASGKLKGISPQLVVKLAGLGRASYIIVEADGAAQKSLKAPSAAEPVVPYNTSLVIPVVGIDAVGCYLTEENVFRPEIVSRLLRLPVGEVISSESIALLMTHHQGSVKGSPTHARIVPFINKMDLDKDLAKGRDLASKILAMAHPRIKHVVLGQAQSPEPVIEVVSRR
jgi:probable selenium-dependent hydroxylase accessory protein YqeC